MNSLIPQARLIDHETGEIVGYMLQSGVRRVALTLEKIKELNLECVTYIEFLELEIIEVLSYKNYFAIFENYVYLIEDLEAIPYKRDGENVILWGYCFKQSHLVPLDDKTALKYALSMRDEESCILK